MKVYVTDPSMMDVYIKIFKKKVSYENIIYFYQRKTQFETKRKRKDSKRQRKHAFRKHVKYIK